MQITKVNKLCSKLVADEGMWLTCWSETMDIVDYYAVKTVSCRNTRIASWREITDAEHQEYEARKAVAEASMQLEEDNSEAVEP